MKTVIIFAYRTFLIFLIAIEISFCCEDGVKVNLFFKKVYERKSMLDEKKWLWYCEDI